ncbi:MAG: hypothetical protein J2P19_34390, partial [Pseudonocardia sp.]|nr:hypothetical protein [Pseudonocardia sp.]
HDPGHYVARGESYELVGGCVEANDLPVAPDTAPAPPVPAPTPVPPSARNPRFRESGVSAHRVGRFSTPR